MVYPANIALVGDSLSWDYVEGSFAYTISAVTNDGATTERRTISAVFASPYDFSANGHTLMDGDVGVKGEFSDTDWAYVVNGVSDGYALTQPNWNGTGSAAPPEPSGSYASRHRRLILDAAADDDDLL
jgi:hypothetical protein